ncbi:MAG: PfkB family carbohydrate kinase [Parachlamydia sp.]|nr:PfkB family carbohydrate kinase [Parachlamydia sp.]
MVRLTGTFSRLGRNKVLVIGDILLDTYTIGKARRISPEAPVAIVHVQREEHRLGGAGNVLLNLVSMGCDVVAIGRVGNDLGGERLLNAFEEEQIDTRGILTQPAYPTPIKIRIIADNQQIVRVDHEQVIPLSLELQQKVIELLPDLLQEVKVIAISDYGKGFLTYELLRAIIRLGRERSIPIIADPKGIEFAKYAQSTILKPNLSEAYAAAGLPREAPLDQVAAKVLQLSQAEMLMVTRSEEGISLFYRDGNRQDFPVRAREVKDVTGAGDTVLAMLACAMANDLTVAEAIQLSNVAAGIAIERVGCARVSLSDLARRLLEQDVVNKVFDQEHLFALQQALHGRKFALLGLSTDEGLSPKLFSNLRELGLRHDWDLLVYVKDNQPDEEFVNLLASLHDVDFILVHGDSLRSLCSRISPDEVYDFQSGLLQKLENAASLMIV